MRVRDQLRSLRTPRSSTPARRGFRRRKLQLRGQPVDIESATRKYLTYVVLPGWIVPGILDWWCHRRAGIERTTGTKESLVHSLMMSEAGAPVALGLIAEINPLVLASMWSAAVAHEATAFWDVSMAERSNRRVRPVEQHVHSFLELLPFMAVSLVSLLYWKDARKMLKGRDRSSWELHLKRRRLPSGYLATLGTLVVAGVVVPYAEELWRCWRTGRGRKQEQAARRLEPAG